MAPAAPVVLVRGLGDVASAVAHRLFLDTFRVVIHDAPLPTTTRRGMAFADVAFDGDATLEGVPAVLASSVSRVQELLVTHHAIPAYLREIEPLLATIRPSIVVDARMRKHARPEGQRGLAELTIGLGPGFVAGRTVDVVVETSWERLGQVISEGPALPLAGEPRPIGGHARDRYVYAPADGIFRTKRQIGDLVGRGEPVAEIGQVVVEAPLDGALRGLAHDGVPVTAGTKVVEVDPRGATAEVRGIGERPRAIAAGAASVIARWRGAAQSRRCP
jgi:xanthine dehydrogenase accessory factor